MESWIPIVSSFIGALAGGSIAKFIETNTSRSRRLQDAYVEFAGTVRRLSRGARDSVFGHDRDQDTEWNEFETARARLLILERDPTRLSQIEVVRQCVEDAHSIIVQIDGPEISPDEERWQKVMKLKSDLDRLDKQLLDLLADVREITEVYGA